MPDRTSDSARIDAWLAARPDDQRRALQELREAIASAAPDAQEAFSYGTPAFRYRDHPLVSYGAAKAHCSLYVMSPAVIVDHAGILAGFSTSKGTIRFSPERPIAADIVARLVRARMAETDERWG